MYLLSLIRVFRASLNHFNLFISVVACLVYLYSLYISIFTTPISSPIAFNFTVPFYVFIQYLRIWHRILCIPTFVRFDYRNIPPFHVSVQYHLPSISTLLCYHISSLCYFIYQRFSILCISSVFSSYISPLFCQCVFIQCLISREDVKLYLQCPILFFLLNTPVEYPYSVLHHVSQQDSANVYP